MSAHDMKTHRREPFLKGQSSRRCGSGERGADVLQQETHHSRRNRSGRLSSGSRGCARFSRSRRRRRHDFYWRGQNREWRPLSWRRHLPYRWNGARWISLGRKAVTNSTGRYTMTVANGYSYRLQAGRAYGGCPTGFAIHEGWHPNSLHARGTTLAANMRMLYVSGSSARADRRERAEPSRLRPFFVLAHPVGKPMSLEQLCDRGEPRSFPAAAAVGRSPASSPP
jgi:hypothetical protein